MATIHEERNALANLADELVGCANILLEEGWVGCEREVLKAKDIIAELAKVSTLGPKHIPGDISLYKAYAKCRAIAKEGANDEDQRA